jgi:hypothetical protein
MINKNRIERFFKFTRHVIAIIIVLACFGFLYMVALKEIPQANRDILNLAAGSILIVLGNVSNYYFGSSKDKSDQDEKLNPKIADKINPDEKKD